MSNASDESPPIGRSHFDRARRLLAIAAWDGAVDALRLFECGEASEIACQRAARDWANAFAIVDPVVRVGSPAAVGRGWK